MADLITQAITAIHNARGRMSQKGWLSDAWIEQDLRSAYQYLEEYQRAQAKAPTPGEVASGPGREARAFDFLAHLARQAAWSEKTFGPGSRAKGVVDHIRKELKEIKADPADLKEWIDVAILALDGAWRSGASPEEIIAALVAKQTKNEGRTWPDWRTMPADKAIEHDRTGEVQGDAGSSPRAGGADAAA